MGKKNLKTLIRSLVIEVVIYAALLVAYFFAVLRYLGEYLLNLFEHQTYVYAFLGLTLIVVQGVFLETVTTFLIRWLRLDRW